VAEQLSFISNILIKPHSLNLLMWRIKLKKKQAVAVATLVNAKTGIGARIVLTKNDASGTLGNSQLDHAAIEGARALLMHGTTKTLKLGPNGENRMDDVSVFVESFAPAPRMIIFGVHRFCRSCRANRKIYGLLRDRM